MEKRGIAIAIVTLCVISVVIGVINSFKPPTNEKVNDSGKYIQKVLSVSGNKLALITLDGPIVSEQSTGVFSSNPFTADNILKAIKKASKDNLVKGVLIKINSPGGTVAMSQEIYNEVLRLRTKKPVVITMLDVAASGGYYIASAGDRIFAQPGTLTGSIGVIFSTFNAQELFSQKLGIQSNVIKSGKFKDTGSMYRAMSEEERKLLQNIIDTTYQQFLTAIEKGRIDRKDEYKTAKAKLNKEVLKQYADGRIFTGEQAQKLGFVDSLGGTFEAKEALNKMAKVKFELKKDLPLVPYNKPTGLSEFLSGLSESLFPNNISMKTLLPISSRYHHKPLYLWE